MSTLVKRHIRVGSEKLKERGCTVVTGGGHTTLCSTTMDRVRAVDNRCPHMGFPLDRGSVKDGILTCHWHHARFDLAGGGTFNPFADDVRTFVLIVLAETTFHHDLEGVLTGWTPHQFQVPSTHVSAHSTSLTGSRRGQSMSPHGFSLG